jgi:hypothetical protein
LFTWARYKICYGERGLLFEEDCLGLRDDGAAALDGFHGLSQPAEMLVLMLAHRPCTPGSALQARLNKRLTELYSL